MNPTETHLDQVTDPVGGAIPAQRKPSVLERAVAEADRTRARNAALAGGELLRRAEVQRELPLRTELGYTDVHLAATRHRSLGERLLAEREQGVLRHDPMPWYLQVVPPSVAALDLLVLHRFCADLFNVLPSDLGPDGLAAIGLAVLGGGVAFTWLTLTGLRLRGFRRDLGQFAWGRVDLFTYLLLVISVVLAGTMAVLMYERVLDRAWSASAYLDAGQAGVLAAAFAVLSCCGNLAVVAVHALDGSPELAEHRRIGRSLRRRAWRLERTVRAASLRLRRARTAMDEAAGPSSESSR